MLENGNIIVLNGTSSAGKTTLARALQSQFDDVYLCCSLDMFWNMTPHNVAANSAQFPNMKQAIAKTARALAETGHNVIVDIIFCGHKTYREFSSELNGLNVLIVKVDCALQELERREIARGDRKPGLAASQLEFIHTDVPYDLIVQTDKNAPEQCAKSIITHVSHA